MLAGSVPAICDQCVVIKTTQRSGLSVHVGYGDPEKDMYEKLLSGDIRLDTATGARRLSQSAYFELWQSLKDRPEYGFVDPSLAQEENGGCAVCGEFLITVPGVAGTCQLPRGQAPRLASGLPF